MTKENQYRAMIGFACFTLGAVANMVLTDSNVENMKELMAEELKEYQQRLIVDVRAGQMHWMTAEYYISDMQESIEELEEQPSIEPSIYE